MSVRAASIAAELDRRLLVYQPPHAGLALPAPTMVAQVRERIRRNID